MWRMCVCIVGGHDQFGRDLGRGQIARGHPTTRSSASLNSSRSGDVGPRQERRAPRACRGSSRSGSHGRSGVSGDARHIPHGHSMKGKTSRRAQARPPASARRRAPSPRPLVSGGVEQQCPPRAPSAHRALVQSRPITGAHRRPLPGCPLPAAQPPSAMRIPRTFSAQTSEAELRTVPIADPHPYKSGCCMSTAKTCSLASSGSSPCARANSAKASPKRPSPRACRERDGARPRWIWIGGGSQRLFSTIEISEPPTAPFRSIANAPVVIDLLAVVFLRRWPCPLAQLQRERQRRR